MKRNRISEATGSGSAGNFRIPIVLSPQPWTEDQVAPFTNPVYSYNNAELAYEEADGDFKETPEERARIEKKTDITAKVNEYLKSFYTGQNDEDGSNLGDVDTPEKIIQQVVGPLKEDLAVWFGTKKKPKGSKQPKGPWVNICRKKEGGGHPPCGRPDADPKGYPKCRAAGVAAKMSDSQKKSACSQKRREEKKDPKIGKGNKPTMVSYKPKNESMKKTITLTENDLIRMIKHIIKEQRGEKVGTLYCYSDLSTINNPSTRPEIEIGPSIVSDVYDKGDGLWSVMLDLENVDPIPDSAVTEPMESYEIDIVPVSRLMSSLKNEKIPLIDSKGKVLITYQYNKRYYCRAKNSSDESLLKSYSKS